MFADALAPSYASAAPAPSMRLEVHEDVAAIDEAWAELERSAPCSIYQTRRFVVPWARTLGRKAGLAPRYVLARDPSGRPLALLCLGLRRHGPVTVARLLGGRDANLQMALLRADAEWTRVGLRRLLRDAACACGADVLAFANQPFRFDGRDNPLALLPHGESPSAACGTGLPADADALFVAKLSKDARKKLRKKEAKLAAIGPLRDMVAATADERAAVLDAFLAQKTTRFDARGIASEFGSDAMRAFIEAASAGGGIELHALLAGERIVATYGGAAEGGRWSGMFNSFDSDEAVARSSPGDLLLLRIVADCCARGLRSFDLGVGEARYKEALCDEPIPLFDAAIGFGPLGRCAALAIMARQSLKRTVKSNPRLLALARRLGR